MFIFSNSFQQLHLVFSEYFEQYRYLCVYIIKHIYFYMLFNFIYNVLKINYQRTVKANKLCELEVNVYVSFGFKNILIL